ncbi:HNH endonuclease [Streptomyces sp. NPDC059851]|uniref:HNH endonuclease n=1 Tax=Streptomyces sp. NPDC059851 TaxID=3346971 RepID=UPI003648D679
MVLMSNEGLCVYCEDAESEVMDHVIPLAKGGPHHWKNLVPACTACNESKGDRLFPRWLMEIEANPKGWAHLTIRDVCEIIHEEQNRAIERIEAASAEIANEKRIKWFVNNTWLGVPESRAFIDRWRRELIGEKELAARQAGYPLPPRPRLLGSIS